MAYDANEARKQTVLFGGFNRAGTGPSCLLADTWLWDGAAWSEHRYKDGEPHPPPRYGHVMAYDGTNVVLFGGYDGTRDLNDTWVWNGTRWSEITITTGSVPDPRSRSAMAFNPAGPGPEDDHALMFGGDQIMTQNPNRDAKLLDDTWVWNGKTWGRPGVPARPDGLAYAAMAYHPGKGVVLHGGWHEVTRLETWVWNGVTWILSNADTADVLANMGPTQSGAMAYHPATGQTLLQAGRGSVYDNPDNPHRDHVGEYKEGTSGGSDGQWNGTWNRPLPNTKATTDPPPRLFPTMAEDRSGNVVFFGGYGGPSDEGTGTWVAQADADIKPPPTNPDDVFSRDRVTLSRSEIEANGEDTTIVTFTSGNHPVEVRTGPKVRAGVRVRFTTSGNVTFAQAEGVTDDKGQFSTKITASTNPGPETITAHWNGPSFSVLGGYLGCNCGSVSTLLSETGLTLELRPSAIPADGQSESTAVASLYKPGTVEDKVCFKSSGNARFVGGDGTKSAVGEPCGRRGEEFTQEITIVASRTAGEQIITATSTESNFTATAILEVGGGRWFDHSTTAAGTPAGPVPGRENAALAFDEEHGLTVLFGGYPKEATAPAGQKPPALDDTWTWNTDSRVWNEVPIPQAERPLAREGAAMAYDASSRQLVLFGGHRGTKGKEGYLGDTWTFNATTKRWTRHCLRGPSPDSSCDIHGGDVPGPSRRYVANMASDGTGVVLFGGTDGWAFTATDDPNGQSGPTDPEGPGHLDDTWVWRNGKWTDVTPQPSAAPANAPRGTTFPGGRVTMPLPPPPAGCPDVCPSDKAEPYPSAVDVGRSGYASDVKVTLKGFTYNGGDIPCAGPETLRSCGTDSGPSDVDIMLVAPNGRAVMLMSDTCGTGDIADVDLTFHGRAPSLLPSDTQECIDKAKAGAAFKPTNRRDREFDYHSPDGFPAPAAPSSAQSTSLADFNGMDPKGIWKLYMVDDGPNDEYPRNPAPEAGSIDKGWDLTMTITDVPPDAPPPAVTSPPARGRAAMAYHPPTGKVVMYGGTQEYRPYKGTYGPSTWGNAFHPLGDTWTWDPKTSTWAQADLGARPGARRSAAMAYHPGTRELMLFGGSPTVVGRVADPEGCAPLAGDRSGFCAEYDDKNDFNQGDDPLDDTWTWDGGGGRGSARPSAHRPAT